jgi:hypothetical protein
MTERSGSDIVRGWPAESQEAAQLVLNTYGEPDEATDSMLIWHSPGPWKRVVATKAFYKHDFPTAHFDSVESFIDYRVPVGMVGALAQFDGSVMVDRTAGEISARCHDEQANLLAINLMHDVVTGQKTPQEAREYYGKEFVDYRRKKPTPYMEELRVEPGPNTADPDEPVLSQEELEKAAREGEQAGGA